MLLASGAFLHQIASDKMDRKLFLAFCNIKKKVAIRGSF